MTKIRLAFAAVLALLLLTACGGKTEGAESGVDSEPHSHYTFWQKTPNGQVLCVWAKSGYGGGLSCDWEHVK